MHDEVGRRLRGPTSYIRQKRHYFVQYRELKSKELPKVGAKSTKILIGIGKKCLS